MKILLVAWPLVTIAHPLFAQDTRLSLRNGDAAPAVTAAVDGSAPLLRSQRLRDPYRYDCVATLNVLDADGANALRTILPDSTVPVNRDSVWIYPERHFDKKSRASFAFVRGVGDDAHLVVGWRPENSGLPHVVEWHHGTAVPTRSDPFPIPVDALVLCGKVPSLNVGLMVPSGSYDGLNIDFDVAFRKAWTGSCVPTVDPSTGINTEHCFLSGMLELQFEGAMTTASTTTLLNSVTAGLHASVKPFGSWNHWLAVGPVGRAEATEALDLLDVAVGLRLQTRLDLVRPENVTTFWKRFTPYPVVTVEYAMVLPMMDRREGTVLPMETRHRARLGLAWTVPMLVNTMIGLKVRADYFPLSDEAAVDAIKPLVDIALRFPLNQAQDVGVIGKFLYGSAPPLYEETTRILAGIHIGL